jgi:hypothetical protein
MGFNGRQWDTMHFYGLTKPFQGADFRGLFIISPGHAQASETGRRKRSIGRRDFVGFVA